MSTPRAVIFDFFGTLVPSFALSSHKAVLREMAEIIGAPPDEFVQGWLGTFTQRVTGQFTSVDANIDSICRALGVSPDPGCYARAVAVRYAYTRRHLVPRPTALATLRELRSRGLKLGLITDGSLELPDLWSETAFASLFDTTVFSCRAKIKKPNPAIYQKAAAELSVACADCLYIGDGGSNELTGARAVGMRPVLLHVSEEQGNRDTHRVDGEAWDGPSIGDLSEVPGRLFLDK